MDVRLSAEQRALRDSAAQVVDRLGPEHRRPSSTTPSGAAKLDAAVAAAGLARAAHRRRRRRAVGVGGRGGDRRRGARPRRWPTRRSSGRRWPPSCGASPARPPPPRPRRSCSTADLGAAPSPTARRRGAVAVDARGAATALVLVPATGGHALGAGRPRAAPRSASTSPGRWPRVAATAAARRPTGRRALDRRRPDRRGPRSAWPSPAPTSSARCAAPSTSPPTTPPSAGSTARPIGSFQAVQHLLADALVAMEGSRSVALHAAWAVDALAARRGAGRRPRWPRRTAPGPPATVCETAIQVHGGIGNTWECLAHVHLRRALLSTDVLGGVGPSLDRVLATTGSEATMDFGDSPDEAAFRARLRAWLQRQQPRPAARRRPSDDYWAGQAAWHQSLYDAGFFGLSWPTDIGGHGPAQRLRRDPRRRAGRRRRAAPPEPRLPGAGDPRARQRRHPAALPARASSTAASGGARASASPTPAPTSRRCAPAPSATATSTSSPATRSGPATPTSPTGASCSPAPTTTSPSTRASPPSPCRCDQPGIEQRPLRMINGITTEFGEVHLRRRPGAGRQHDRRARRGLAAGHDRGQPRARARRARLRRPLPQDS